MAKRRTRAEKIRAALKKPSQVNINTRATEVVKTNDFRLNKPILSPSYYVPEIALPMNLVKRDLTKTVAVTILALILQGLLAIYLYYQGGWQQLHAWLPV